MKPLHLLQMGTSLYAFFGLFSVSTPADESILYSYQSAGREFQCDLNSQQTLTCHMLVDSLDYDYKKKSGNSVNPDTFKWNLPGTLAKKEDLLVSRLVICGLFIQENKSEKQVVCAKNISNWSNHEYTNLPTSIQAPIALIVVSPLSLHKRIVKPPVDDGLCIIDLNDGLYCLFDFDYEPHWKHYSFDLSKLQGEPQEKFELLVKTPLDYDYSQRYSIISATHKL